MCEQLPRPAVPAWTEQDAALARPFFEGDLGKKLLSVLHHRRPLVTAVTADERRTQFEKKEGYELAEIQLLQLLAEQRDK